METKNISGIYKITNLKTNKIYVGSAKNLKTRKRLHFSDLKFNKHHSCKLQNSYNIHGKEVFIFEVLELCKEKKLLKREQYYLDTLQPFYNTNKIAGSRQGTILSEGTKNKIRNSLLGNKLPRNVIEKIRVALSKPIIAINLKTKKVREFPSLTKASQILNIHTTHLSKIAQGKAHSIHGYTFVYKKEYDPKKNYIVIPGKTRPKILCFSLKGKLIKIFDNSTKAAIFVNGSTSGINQTCYFYERGNTKNNRGVRNISYKRYVWKFQKQ